MIGSLGRDRAEASGELRPPGAASGAVPVPETARELVTILPRRITREMQAVQPPADGATGAPAQPVEPPASRPSMPRVVNVGTGVSRPDTGPGAAAIALIVLAAILAGVAVFLWIKKSRRMHEVATISEAGLDATALAAGDLPDADVDEYIDASTAMTIDAALSPRADAGAVLIEIDAAAPKVVDAAVAAVSDAAAPKVVDAAVVAVSDAASPKLVDAGAPRLADAGTPMVVDAGVPRMTDAGVPRPDAGVDPAVQAKQLMEQAHDANQEGDFEKALALANSSLKLRRTARAYIVRAQALQRLDRIDDALDSVDSAEELAPDYASVFEARGSILWAAGRYAAARRVYERFLELEPDSARANQIRRKITEPN